MALTLLGPGRRREASQKEGHSEKGGGPPPKKEPVFPEGVGGVPLSPGLGSQNITDRQSQQQEEQMLNDKIVDRLETLKPFFPSISGDAIAEIERLRADAFDRAPIDLITWCFVAPFWSCAVFFAVLT